MKKENLVEAKQIAEESFRQGLVSQSIPKSVRKYTDKLAMRANGLIYKKKVLEWIDDEIGTLEGAFEEYGDYHGDYYRGRINSLLKLRRLIRRNKFG